MKKAFLSFFAALMSIVVLAQEETKKVDVNIDTGGGSAAWYSSPWVWIVGAAVFILLLVALTRGGRRAD
jgi:hypothetical protein